MRVRRPSPIVMAPFAMSAGAVAASVSRSETKVHGSIRPDKALVYLSTASAKPQFLYADDTLLGPIDWNSYGLGYVDSGKHLVWTNQAGVSLELEFLGGRTDYLRVLEEFSLLREEEARRLLERIPVFKTTSDKEKLETEKQIAHGYETAKRREAERERFEVETPPAPVPPAPGEGKVRVPLPSLSSAMFTSSRRAQTSG